MSEQWLTNGIFSEGEILVTFGGSGLLSAEVLAASIDGWNGIYERIPRVLSVQHPLFKHLRLNLYIEAVDPGSKIIKAFIRIVAKSEQDAEILERKLNELASGATKTLLESIHLMSPTGKIVLGSALTIIVAASMINIAGFLGNSDRVSINNVSHSIINVGAGHLQIEPSVAYRMVEDATRDPKRLASQTISALGPSAVLSHGTLTVGEGQGAIVISGEEARIIANVSPDDLTPRIEERVLRDTTIIVRALDLDKKTSGWAGYIPDLGNRRTRFILADSVSLDAAGSFIGDVTAEVAIDLDGNEKVKRATITSITQP